MKVAHFAIVLKEVDSDYGIEFPDFPGCISSGATSEEAEKSGREALEFHIRGMVEDGDELPVPGAFCNCPFALMPAEYMAITTVEVEIQGLPLNECSQCGQVIYERACGPTHALLAAERRQA